MEKLISKGEKFAVVFYNPNIHPTTEYEKRRDEQKRLCKKWKIQFIELEYNYIDWLFAAGKYKQEPERGKRCSICFHFRLKHVMEYAKENGYKGVASVLGVSRWKDLAQVNNAAQLASQETGVPYIEIEGRKDGLQERRAELIKELELYNQDYCGCIYSQLQDEKNRKNEA